MIRIFPNEESAIRLMGALLLERDELWSTRRREMDMADYMEWKQKEQSKSEDLDGKEAAD